MARSVAFYLTRFDEAPKVVAKPPPEPVFELEALEEPEPLPPPAPVLSDEMRSELIEEGRAAAWAEYEDAIARERVAFAAQLQGERSRWTNEEGERLAERFHAALDDFSARVGEDVERILEPFVIREIREQMIVSLLDRLRIMIADRENPIVHLSGPADLLEAVSGKLNGDGVATRIEEADGVDLRARVGSTSVETRLGEWIEQLRAGDEAA
jgi:hypothetical protein